MGTTAPRPRIILGNALQVILLIGSASIQAGQPEIIGETRPPEHALCLRYGRPAGAWLEALPLGNGRFVFMLHGGDSGADCTDRQHVLVKADLERLAAGLHADPVS